MERMGAPPEVIEAWLGDGYAEGGFKVHPANREIVELFCRLQTSWTLAASGHLLGLDYSQVKTVMESIKRWPDDVLFEGLQVMEFAAVAEAVE